jgi:hypothetical protein
MPVHLFIWKSRKYHDKAGYKPGKKTPSGEANLLFLLISSFLAESLFQPESQRRWGFNLQPNFSIGPVDLLTNSLTLYEKAGKAFSTTQLNFSIFTTIKS